MTHSGVPLASSLALQSAFEPQVVHSLRLSERSESTGIGESLTPGGVILFLLAHPRFSGRWQDGRDGFALGELGRIASNQSPISVIAYGAIQAKTPRSYAHFQTPASKALERFQVEFGVRFANLSPKSCGASRCHRHTRAVTAPSADAMFLKSHGTRSTTSEAAGTTAADHC